SGNLGGTAALRLRAARRPGRGARPRADAAARRGARPGARVAPRGASPEPAGRGRRPPALEVRRSAARTGEPRAPRPPADRRDGGRTEAMSAPRIAILAILLVGAALRGSAVAHGLAPALLDVTESGDGRVAVAWKTSLFGVPGVALQPVLPPGCRTTG